MKRTIALYIFLFLMVAQLAAQQNAQYKYHIFDDYLLNPGYVGMQDYYHVLVGRDQRFYGLNESTPQTYFLSLNSRVGEGYIFAKDGKINKFFEDFGNMALGLQLFQYQYSLSTETNIGLTYGYHLNLNQNYKRKNPRKMVLAITPRLKRLGFNYNDIHFYDNGAVSSEVFNDPVAAIEPIRSWMFTADVGTVYKTVHGEFGLAALDLFQTKDKLESEFLTLNDTVSYSTYDSLYPAKFMVNGKLTYIEMYNSGMFDLAFIPSAVAIFSPKIQGSEFYVDLMMEGKFKQHIAGVRSEVVMVGQLGLNIYHSRIYEPATFIQPYVSFDFRNFTIMYAQTINIDSDLVSTTGISGGGQVSILFKINNDRVLHSKPRQVSWHD
ncbi:MAG: type IX secretion system membrane protein PorP/SprF [Prolixibacteraceae bacterium]